MPRSILIVEDEAINRQLLSRILRDEYEIVEACNGQEAMTLLGRMYKYVSAVLLDLSMPVMDGYEVLRQVNKNPSLSQIPIIVATSSTDEGTEVRALALGANDFITKPYSPEVILHRLRNTINLRETAAIINAKQRDKLTGLYNRETFFEKAADLIRTQQPGYYVMACYDVHNFKLINDQYGSTKGDEVLKYLATVFKGVFEALHGLCCRITADNFAVLYPSQHMSANAHEKIKAAAMSIPCIATPVTFSVGRYIVSDLTLSVSAMYDRAVLAGQSVKGRFDDQVAFYDESMRQRILREQEITNEMNAALEAGQFEPWFQPQYNHVTGALIGAEALVRWRHPKNGMIPPSEFIPVFERSGFVYEMDKSIWRQTCALMREWIDEGRAPLPVSVNVSRYDILRSDFFETITGYVEQYAIGASQLRLEITESAFASEAELIIGVVERLIAYGFTVEIDDFGSGYSSLNTLKDVPANILKLDMRFLKDDENSVRGGNILESIVRMAKWLGMPVIAEGVETKAQADFLQSIGCFYIQGYYYARPMPVEEFKRLAAGATKQRKIAAMEAIETWDSSAFWNPQSMDTLIFNSYVGGACIFEYHHGKIEMIRANEKYARSIGGDACTIEYVLGMVWEEHMDAQAAEATTKAIQQAIQTGDDATYEAAYFGLPGSSGNTYLRTTFRVIARTADRYLLYATNENITAQREAERKQKVVTDQLAAIMNHVNGGITATNVDDSGFVRFVFSNDKYFAMQGYTRQQYENEVQNAFDSIHPDDRERVRASVMQALNEQGTTSFEYRVKRRSGEYFHVRNDVSVTSIESLGKDVLLSIMTDISSLVEAQQAAQLATEQTKAIIENINGGVTAAIVTGDVPRLLFANKRFYELYGCTKEQYEQEYPSPFDPILPQDRDRVVEQVRQASLRREPFSVTYRNRKRDGSIIWLQSNMSIIYLPGIDEPVQLSVANDVTALHTTV